MKRNQGITLIALVITIVVLIILAGVTINTIIGENGIIIKAQEAKVNMQNAQGEEQEVINSLYNRLLQVEREEKPSDHPNVEKYIQQVPIPKGFYYVGGTVEEGLVISDSSADENKGTDHEVAKTLVGNQFVWIPVNETDRSQMFYYLESSGGGVLRANKTK